MVKNFMDTGLWMYGNIYFVITCLYTWIQLFPFYTRRIISTTTKNTFYSYTGNYLRNTCIKEREKILIQNHLFRINFLTLSKPLLANLSPRTLPMPASCVTSFSPMGSATKLRCFWLVVDMVRTWNLKAELFLAITFRKF